MRGFAEASYEMTEGAFESDADKRLLVIFHLFPQKNTQKSIEEGRPIYEDKVYVTIMVPGDKESIIDRPAMEMDFQRFPRQYQAFRQKQEAQIVGTPLSALTWMAPSQIKELEYFNVMTVEHLAEVNEGLASRMQGLFDLKRRAQDFIRAAKEAAPLLEMRTELDKRDGEIEALKRQVAELGAMALANATEKAKGPKPKEV